MMPLTPLTQHPPETSDFAFPLVIDRSNTNRVRKGNGQIKPTLGQVAFVLANRFLARISTSLASSRLQQIFETPRPFTSKKDDLKILERATISWLDYDGAARLPLYSFGHGPTILLVHGLSGSGSQLCSFVAPLTKAGFRVVICDLPAHGRADGKRISFPKIASAIELIAAHIGPVASIIAHSNGAATTALALSRDLETQSLVFISPPEDLKGYLYRLSKMIGFNKKVTQHAETILAQNYGLPFDAVRGSNLVMM